MLLTISTSLTVNTKDEQFFKDLGARVALARKERGITQVQLSATLGIAQQTLAHYEGRRLRLPAPLLPTLAQVASGGRGCAALGRAGTTRGAGKRGPAPKLQQHLERISALPKPRQRAVMDVIGAMLAQQGR